MNWTGGRLKCHARLYGTRGSRAQRHHSARWKQNTHSPSISGILFSSHMRASESRDTDVRDCHDTPLDSIGASKHADDSHQQFFQTSTEISNEQKENVRSSANYITARSRMSNSDRWVDDLTRRGDDESAPIGRVSADVEDMKKKLLAQPDWLGLSTHRPARIDFPSTSSVAEIGRHRKIKVLAGSDAGIRLSCRDSQVKCNAETATRKRKREDQDHITSDLRHKTSDRTQQRYQTQPTCTVLQAPTDPDGHRSDSVPGARATTTEPRAPVVDCNRRYYHLSDHSSPLSDVPANLVSLYEVKSLKNFDAVKELHLKLRNSQYATIDEDSDCGIEKGHPPASLESRSRYHTDHNGTKCAMRGPRLTPSRRFTNRIDNHATPRQTPSARHLSTPVPEAADQDLLESSVGSSSKGQTLQLQRAPYVLDDNIGVAIRDFAMTSSVELETCAAGVTGPSSGLVAERFRLEPVELEVQEMPPIFKTNVTTAGRGIQGLFDQVPLFSCDPPLPAPPLPKFELDAGWDSNAWDVANCYYDEHSEQRNMVGQPLIFNTISSPYFECGGRSYTELCESKGEFVRSQTPNSPRYGEFKSNSLGLMTLTGIDDQCRFQEQFSSTTSEPSLGGDGPWAGHELAHLRPVAPRFDRGSQLAWRQQKKFAIDSSSPVTQVQRNVPVKIFSTPPKHSDGTHISVDRDNFSPYFHSLNPE